MGVAHVDLVRTRSPGRMAAHLLQATEPEAERDAAAVLAGQEIPRQRGSILRPWPDMPAAVAQAMGADPRRPLTEPEVVALADGRRADGTDVPRPARARRFAGGDADGKQQVKFIHLTLAPDISWAVAHANARTPAGAALILSVFERAADRTMADVEARAAVVTRRVGGTRVEERGRLAAWSVTHHATKPFRDGTSAPDLHRQYVVPNAVVLRSGEVRALDGRRLLAMQRDRSIGRLLSYHLQQEGQAAGLRVELRQGAAVLSDVPERVREHFSRRSREAEENARTFTREKGEDWIALTEGQQRARVRAGMRATASGPRDGMADRAAWRRACESLGFPPADLAGQERIAAAPSRQSVEQDRAGLQARAAALRSAAVQTRQHVQRLRQGAELAVTFGPSIAVNVTRRHIQAALDRPRTRRALLTTARLLRVSAVAFYRRYQVRAAYRTGVRLREAFERNRVVQAGRAVARQLRPSVMRRRAEMLADGARTTLGAVRAFRDALGEGWDRLREVREAQRLLPPTAADRVRQRVRAEVVQGRAMSRSFAEAREAGTAIGARRDAELLAAQGQSRMPAAAAVRGLRARAEGVETAARKTPPPALTASGGALAERRDQTILEAVAQARGSGIRVPEPPGPAARVSGTMLDGAVPGATAGPARPAAPARMTAPQIRAAHEALRTLAALDEDQGQTRNGVGFNRDDGERGRELAGRKRLTRAEAVEARTMLRKYWRQIGEEALAAMGARPLARPASTSVDPTSPTAAKVSPVVGERSAADGNGSAIVVRSAPVRPLARVEVSRTEAEAQLRDALRQYGLKPDGHEIRWDSGIQYLPTIDNKRGEKSGAYIAHWEGRVPAAAIYNWKATRSESGFVGTWRADGDTRPLTPAERAAMEREAAARAEAARTRREEGLARGAETARATFAAARPAPADHPYLARKGLPVTGERVDAQGNLLIPLYDAATDRLVNLQHISPNGAKWPLEGAQKTGTAALVGTPQARQPIIIAEGYATAKRLNLALGQAVTFALDAGNLLPVAQALRARFPDREIVFAADNDHHLPLRPDGPRSNVGIAKAERAAQAVGNARVWAPPALEERQRTATQDHPAGQAVGTDWDDYAQVKGGGTVKALWDLERSSARTPSQAPGAPGLTSDGERTPAAKAAKPQATPAAAQDLGPWAAAVRQGTTAAGDKAPARPHRGVRI
ncbi:relaxase domain-containing protein [Paracraurococcus lichenis]|uniref:Relaxase domain-containing protein n=1 Tax=Paracraurococcus lichenis TaxID=3064888 RepID=A0ABT9E9G5_9PROT|nr:relaxase domain-containing protein [Paracraurococcus sp. LOR1-02]MDO9712804.1 relaxase domain-containing protein [Paracraurococcus sp. LOR1-02]